MTDFSSRSSRIPARHYKRRYTITQHAVERFRERVDEEFRHRDDEDLANLLDERVGYAEFNYQVRDPRAPDDITTLRSVACRNATYYAVIRNQAVVTVLDESMARKNFDGQWSPVMQAPFEVLRDLKIAPPAASATSSSGNFPAVQSQATTIADPLAEAGAAYALACKRRRACADAVASLKDDLALITERLDRATEDLQTAEQKAADAHQRLLRLAEGDPS